MNQGKLEVVRQEMARGKVNILEISEVKWTGMVEFMNLSGLDLGGACSPGPASDSSRWSNLEPEQCGQGGYTCRERGQAQCG